MESQWFVLLQVNLIWQIHDAISYRKRNCFLWFVLYFFFSSLKQPYCLQKKIKTSLCLLKKLREKCIQMNLVI